MRRKTAIMTTVNTVTEITIVLLMHSPSPGERPVRLGGMSSGMLESDFSAPSDVVGAGD